MDTSITENISLFQSDRHERQISMPFFTIGVTTYNRRELLKQALDSILNQTFSDFEVIVGNDYTQEVLSAELFDIEDPRFQFVNHPQNLKEVGNMNALLKMAKGRYFTWLSDDDLYSPGFLEVLHENLGKFDFPSVAFTTYETFLGTSFPALSTKPVVQVRKFTGSQFLHTYLQGNLKIIGPYGVFETEALRQVGIPEDLCDSAVGLYGEYMFLVRIGTLKNVIHVDSPLVHYRAHEGSYTWKTEQFGEAGGNLIRESIQVLSKPELAGNFIENLLSILHLVVTVYAVHEADDVKVKEYLFSLRNQFSPLMGTIYYLKSMLCLVLTGIDYLDDKKDVYDRKLFNPPARMVRFAIWFRSFFPVPRQFWG